MLVELGLVEQRYRAVCEVLDEAKVVDVARAQRRGPPDRPRLAAGLCQPLGVDVLGALGPGLGCTVDIDAAPAALAPHQASRTTESGQVPDGHRLSLVGHRPGPTAPAARELRRRGLHGDDHLVGFLGHLKHSDAVQSQQGLGQPGTVVYRRRPSVVSALSSREDGGASAACGGSLRYLPVPTGMRRAPYGAWLPPLVAGSTVVNGEKMDQLGKR